jgi:Fanconi anemia group M protein
MTDFTLTVDSREKDNATSVLDKAGIPYVKAALETGDYQIVVPEGKITIERKQMTDFIGSLMSGRLEDQLRRLSEHEVPGLVITGSFSDYKRYAKFKHFTQDHVEGAIASCVVKFGLRFVIWIQSDKDNPHATGIKITSKVLRKIAEGKIDKIPDRKLKRFKTDEPALDIVRMMCGVSGETAKRLLKEFGCLKGIIDATDEQLIGVKGMGRTRIAKLRKVSR